MARKAIPSDSNLAFLRIIYSFVQRRRVCFVVRGRRVRGAVSFLSRIFVAAAATADSGHSVFEDSQRVDGIS